MFFSYSLTYIFVTLFYKNKHNGRNDRSKAFKWKIYQNLYKRPGRLFGASDTVGFISQILINAGGVSTPVSIL